MKKLLLTASVAALAIPAVAHADPYIAISGGVATAEDMENRGTLDDTVPATTRPNRNYPAIAAGTEYGFDTNVDLGWNANAQLGYAFDNGFRLELDGSYVTYDIDFHRNAFVGGTNIGQQDAAILTRGAITLSVNGTPRQQGDLADLIWNVAETIATLSQAWTLAPGDLIYTGTPAGVGAVVAGDLMEARIDGLGTLRVAVR